MMFYLPNLKGGGAERVFLNMMNHFSNSYHINLVVNRLEGPYVEKLDEQIDVKVLEKDKPRSSIFEIRKQINTKKPDIIFSNLTHCNLTVTIARFLSKHKPKLLIREANSFISSRKNSSTYRLFFERIRASIIYRLADRIVVNSQGSKTELMKAIFMNEEKISVINNSLDIDLIKSESKKKLDRDIVQFLDGSPYIVASGRLEENKGFDVLISAFNQMNKSDFKLAILGEGSLRKKLEKQIDALDLNRRVLLCGFRKNPYSILNNAEVFVLSSRFEGMPNVLLEALALGLPIVSTDCPSGPKEILQDLSYSKLVPVDDLYAMSHAIEMTLAETDGGILPVNSFDINEYSIEITAKEYLKLVIE